MICEPDDPCAPASSGKEQLKVFLYLPTIETTIAAGYTHIAIERSRDRGTTFVRITNERTHIPLEAGKHNYVFIEDAKRDWLYQPVLINLPLGVPADSVQPPRQAVDVSYEAVLTIDELKRIYLFGVDLTNDQNVPYPDEVFAHGIRQAVDRMEHELDIPLQPQKFVERYDFYRRDYENYMFVQLRRRPVITVDAVSLDYPSGQNIINFPKEWIRIDRHAGELRILPSRGTFSQLLIGSGGGFLPLVFGGNDQIPDLINVTYFAGFDLGIKHPRNEYGLPNDIKEIVGKIASYGPLNLAGDLIAGAAIASKSIGIDGLSQSVNTTASATNSGYGARILIYEREVKQVLPMLRRYYRGARMIVA
jgi:hypothetical protein